MNIRAYAICGILSLLGCAISATVQAACPQIPAITRTPTIGSPFATGNRDVTLMSEQTSDNVRITGGCIDVQTLSGGTGTPQSILGEYTPRVLQILSGSAASPQTAAGNAVKISNYVNVPYTSCGNNSNDAGCIAALSVNSVAADTTNMTTEAIQIGASNGSSTLGSGGQTPDVFAIHAKGIKTGGVGFAAGAYLVGQRDADTAYVQGAEISAWNNTPTDCGITYNGAGVCSGVWIASRGLAGGTRHVGPAVHIGLGDGNSIWDAGIIINENATLTADFDSHSSAARGVIVSGDHASGALIVNVGAGYFGLNIFSPAALFHIANSLSLSAYTTNGAVIRQDTMTITDTSSSGTVSNNYIDAIHAPSLAASSATTYTNAATLYVEPPSAGTNVTITNPFALFSSGNIKLNGGIWETANLSTAAWTTNGLYLRQSGTITDTTSSGVVGNVYNNAFTGSTMAASSATTYTNAITAYFGPPVAGTNVTITNPLAIRVGGVARFDSTLNMNGTSSVSGTRTCTVNQALTLIFTNGVLTGGTCNS